MRGPQVVGVSLQEDLSVLHEERVVDEVLDVGDEVGGHDEQRRGVELAQDASRMTSRVAGSTPLMGSSSRYTRACLDMMRLIWSFSPMPLLISPRRRSVGQCEEVDHRGRFVGVEVAKERGVDADRVRCRPLRVEEVGVGQVGDDLLGGDAGRVPSMVTVPS